MKKLIHRDIFQLIEQWAPLHLAYDWDNVGLQIGSAQDETTKVMVTLDVVESVVDEAIKTGANLIIAHHPLLFQSLKKIDYGSFKGKVIQKLIANQITVYAAHTNLDIAKNGVNDLLSDALAIKQKTHLVETYVEPFYKLVVYVPKDHAENVRNALGDKGLGHIGNYSHCSFNTEGTGTFRPAEGTNPFIGNKNELTMVEEVKIETVVMEKDLQKALATMKKHHPYEEVAYDLYQLAQKGTTYGLGVVGSLDQRTTLNDLCAKVKKAFNVEAVRVTGEDNKWIRKVAILGGSGEKYIQQAFKQGADVFITGDMTFHQAQDAYEMGLAVIDPGHYIEEIMKQATADYLSKLCTELEFVVSTIDTNPFRYV